MIGKRAQDMGTAFAPTFCYASAREGMWDFLAQLTAVQGHPPRVLLPSFIGWSPNEGSGVFDPVAGLGLEFGFYNVSNQLQVDVPDYERCLAERRYDVVVLIHYFGRTQAGVQRLVEAAHRDGAVVVEDLAHGFFTAQGGGPAARHGDLLLYSLHKMFPLTEGGLVTYRNLGCVRRQASTRPELAARVLDFNWREISEARRENFTTLHRALSTLEHDEEEFELLWPTLAPSDTPQTLPVRILRANRDDIYHRMNADGFGMVSLYHTLIEELHDRPDMVSLSRSIINFPVHQDVRPDGVADLVASFVDALRRGSVR